MTYIMSKLLSFSWWPSGYEKCETNRLVKIFFLISIQDYSMFSPYLTIENVSSRIHWGFNSWTNNYHKNHFQLVKYFDVIFDKIVHTKGMTIKVVESDRGLDTIVTLLTWHIMMEKYKKRHQYFMMACIIYGNVVKFVQNFQKYNLCAMDSSLGQVWSCP